MIVNDIIRAERVNSRVPKMEREYVKKPDKEVLQLFELLRDHDADSMEIRRCIKADIASLITKASTVEGSKIFEKGKRNKLTVFGWLGREA